MAKLFYSIGEVAELVGENPSAIRFWSNHFERFIKPSRNAKGNRRFTEDDIEYLRQIKFLVDKEGLTLEGVEKRLAADRKGVDRKLKAVETLRKIRRELTEVRKAL
jgi:DNA-binding transcriptional MerR regulator